MSSLRFFVCGLRQIYSLLRGMSRYKSGIQKICGIMPDDIINVRINQFCGKYISHGVKMPVKKKMALKFFIVFRTVFIQIYYI